MSSATLPIDFNIPIIVTDGWKKIIVSRIQSLIYDKDKEFGHNNIKPAMTTVLCNHQWPIRMLTCGS